MKLNKLLYHIREKEDRIPTGIPSLDMMIGGLVVGGITAVAARPSMGKTPFAMTVVRNVGIIGKVPTAVLSLEDDSNYVAKRLLATWIGWDAVRSQECDPLQLTDEQKGKIGMLQQIGFNSQDIENADILEKMKEAPVWIEHDAYVTMDELVSRIERLKRENNIRLLVIDNFGHIAMDGYASEKEQKMLKLLQTVERLNIALLVTAGVLRSVEARGGIKKPCLCDIENEACLEKYASLIMFLYRPEYYCIYDDYYGSTLNKADVIIARNRRGNTGEIRLEFANKASFEELSHDETSHMSNPASNGNLFI